jgi:3-mercaptopyruvate sulfurtransferase SseA
LPHMLPSGDAFAAAVSALGIENKDGLVVYDGKGIFSAARVWWCVVALIIKVQLHWNQCLMFWLLIIN